MKILAAVLRPDAINSILEHAGMTSHPPPIAPARAPPEDDGGQVRVEQKHESDWQAA